MTPAQMVKWDKLKAWRQSYIDKEKEAGAPMFLGFPDRWYEEGPYWRCPNNHISRTLLKSEGLGYDACLKCYEFVVLTFPEDTEDVLV